MKSAYLHLTKKKRTNRLALVVAIIVLAISCISCVSEKKPVLTSDERLGYNVYDMINLNRDYVLEEFSEKKIEPEMMSSSESASAYDVTGMLFHEYTTIGRLMFSEYGNEKGQRLYQYLERADLDAWPEEEDGLGKLTIDLYEALLEKYGEPDYLSPTFRNSEQLLSTPADREVSWEIKEKDLRVGFHIFGNNESFSVQITYESISGTSVIKELNQ